MSANSHSNPLVGPPLGSSTPILALRAREAAVALSISESLVRALAAANEIPHVRLRGTVLFPVDGLRAWLQSKEIQAGDVEEVRKC
jgi:excisionase family DNA binding protein